MIEVDENEMVNIHSCDLKADLKCLVYWYRYWEPTNHRSMIVWHSEHAKLCSSQIEPP